MIGVGNLKKVGIVPMLLCAAMIALTACAEVIRQHGYIPPAEDVEDIIIGIDTRDTVETVLGKPATTGVVREDGFYYIGSKIRHFGARAPQEVERQVLAVSFSPDGTVANIERFGLERGEVVVLSRRVTETTVRDVTFIRQIIRNFGQLDLGEALDG